MANEKYSSKSLSGLNILFDDKPKIKNTDDLLSYIEHNSKKDNHNKNNIANNKNYLKNSTNNIPNSSDSNENTMTLNTNINSMSQLNENTPGTSPMAPSISNRSENNNNESTRLKNHISHNHNESKPKDEKININNFYSLSCNTIPPYVLDRLSHYTNDTFVVNSDDPYTESFQKEWEKNRPQNGPFNDWGDFINSIKNGNTSIPVKTSFNPNNANNNTIKNTNNNNFNNGPELSQIDEENSIYSYQPSVVTNNSKITNEESKSKKQLANEIFKMYDLHSKWKGGHRLKGLFDCDGLHSDNCSVDNFDEEDDESNSDSNDYEYNATDLEKGYKNGHHLNHHRHLHHPHLHRHNHRHNINRYKREQDIKERAKLWYEENRKNIKPRLINSIMTNSYIPLFFRLISITLTTVALALSAKIVEVTDEREISQQASPLMALIVQSVALLYLLYVTYDEFTSQPIGLRNPTTKITLILLDLFFIIFSSANLSLSFQSIYDTRWVCKVGILEKEIFHDIPMCKKVKALTAFLFVTLVVWCINFTISVFRIVHVVSNTREKI